MIGLHHQGVFRVSGSQVEISHFKNIFETGMHLSVSNICCGVVHVGRILKGLFSCLCYGQSGDFTHNIINT